VTTPWGDLAARARGLGTHLLRRDELDALAAMPDVDALADAFRSRGLVAADSRASAEQLERAVRRAAAARLRVLSRWAGDREAALAIIFADEDRRSVRALLRGAVQHADPDDRVAGLIPTPTLPERALAQLAAQPAAAAIATLLVAWNHPFGPALLPLATGTQPDLLTMELRLDAAFAAQALRGARASHQRDLVAYVRETIDLENASAALVLATHEGELRPGDAFIRGGARLTLPGYLDAIDARGVGEAGRRLAAVFWPAALAAVFERAVSERAMVESALLRHRIAAQAAAARRDPAGVASILWFAMRQRAEVIDLQRIIWGATLAVPHGVIDDLLVTA